MGYGPARLEKRKTLVDLEGKFLMSHPTIGHANRPGKFTQATRTSYTYNVTHLSTGDRPTRSLEDYTDEYTKDQIWIFGCSFTYGGSLNDEETYPWLLQKHLRDYEVTNFGVIAYGTLHSFIQFQEAFDVRKKPKVAIIAYASFHDERNTDPQAATRRERYSNDETSSLGELRRLR